MVAEVRPVEQLLHPTDGLQPLRLRLLDGRVVLNDQNSVDQQGFMQLVALGIRPGLIEEGGGSVYDKAQSFASTFLPSSNRLHSLSGADEFQSQDKRRDFLTTYADHLRSLAPKPPFEFASVVPFRLAAYDDRNQGFSLPQLDNALFLRFNTQGVTFGTSFSYPKSFWPLAPEAARNLLADLEGTNGGDPRQVQLVAVFRAVAAEPASMRLDLRLLRLAIYDAKLNRELYRLGEAHEQVALTGKGFADMIHPPPGIRPWLLQTFDKLPLFDPNEPYNGGRMSSSQFQTFGRLIAAGNVPGVIEADPIDIGATFLTDEVKRTLFSGPGSFAERWNGEDEFERASSKQMFFDRYAPLIRQIAPKPPFRFIYTDEASLNEYDPNRHGFPIGFGTDEIQRLLSNGWLQTDSQFAWPDLFWPIEPQAAHVALGALQAPGRQGSRFTRSVRVAATISATAVDPTTHRLQLRLDRLRILTPDLSTLLYEIPVVNDAVALSAGQSGTKLQVASPVVFNDLVACVALIDALGNSVPEQDLKRCQDLVATRDADFYRQGGSSAALAPNDARRPFFPRSGPVGTPAERANFVAWAQSYSAGLPDTAVTPPIVGSSPYDATDRTFAAFPGSSLGESAAFKTMLDSEGLQRDQVLSVSSALATTVLFVLPNRVSAYSLSVPKTVLEDNQAWNATGQTVFRIGRPRMTRTDAGKPALTIAVTPIRTSVAYGAKILGQRSYDGIASLDAHSFTTELRQTARPVAVGPIRLDSATVDLLTAAAVGEHLSPEALTYMVVRRWVYENSQEFVSDRRFFAFGKRAPSVQEANGLGPAFTRWAAANAPALPLKVILPGSIDVKAGQTSASWSRLTCFSGSMGSMMNSLSQTMTANADLADCARHKATLLSRERRECAAALAVNQVSAYLNPLGGECRSTLTLPFGNPVQVAARLSRDLPTPDLHVLGGDAKLAVSVTLTVTAVNLSASPPSARDLLPDTIVSVLRPALTDDKHGEFVTLSMDFAAARYADRQTHTVLATLGPESGADVAAIVQAYVKATAGLEAEAHPSGSYGPDLVGIRLGMSFEQAEQIIREHMDVGRVYQGARAFETGTQQGFIRPLTSGSLFVSRDGREMIAIHDEAPAAAGRVLAAWRRVLIPSGTFSPAETLAGLQAKYGPPKQGQLGPGAIMQWFSPPGIRCTSLYQFGRNQALKGYWSDSNGQAAVLAGDGSPRWPVMPEPLFDPSSNRGGMFNECGPFVTANYLEDRQPGGTDQLDTILTDIYPYTQAYAASRKALQASATAKPAEAPQPFRAAYGPDMVGVKLGMSFDEAEAAIRQHMRVGRVFQGAASDPPAAASSALPGTGTLFVSDTQDEVVAILDAPGAPRHVVAAWRKIYSPLNIDRDLVSRRSVEKYGQPTYDADAGRLMAWGSGPAACSGGDASAFDKRIALETGWTDDGSPFAWHAVNGDDAPTMPVITAANDGVAPGQTCGPRVRLSFRSEQGNPPMNVTETILTDPGQQIIALQPIRQRQAAPAAVKF